MSLFYNFNFFYFLERKKDDQEEDEYIPNDE